MTVYLNTFSVRSWTLGGTYSPPKGHTCCSTSCCVQRSSVYVPTFIAVAHCPVVTIPCACQVLDVSFNSIGGVGVDVEGVTALASYLGANRSLTHLDISHNQLNGEEHLEALSEALNKNHSLLGLHVAGSHGLLVQLGVDGTTLSWITLRCVVATQAMGSR